MPQTMSPEQGRSPHAGAGPARFAGCFSYTQAETPARTLAFDADGEWVATFTEGARTVTLAGPCRTFSDPTGASPVTSHTWVRLLEEPFAGEVDEAWLEARLADSAPDLLAIAVQYLAGAPPLYGDDGMPVAGDAAYGPQKGADFNDYLGIPWTYADGRRDRPEARQLQCLDCSGFVRMVWGYRGGLPLSLTVLPDGSALPRHAFQMYEGGPGPVLIENTGQQVTDFSVLAPGDLLFFDATQEDGDRLDHVGIYLGMDEDGLHRFLSSRKAADGPTFGDFHGSAVLEGSGLYARAFRAARRL